MRIFLVEQNVKVSHIVNPELSYVLNRDEDLNHASFCLDQTIFGGRQLIDWVLFTKHEEIKFEEFCIFEKYIPIDSKIIFSTKGNSLESFYCRPEVFSLLGNRYKINDDIFHFLSRHKIDIQHI